MNIRDFCPNDRAIYMEFSRDFYSGGATLHPVDEQNFVNTFEACIAQNPYTRGLMIENEQGQSVGYALLSFTWSNEVGGKVLMFEEFYIAPQHRGSKYGSRFMQWLLQEYKDSPRIRLEVCQDNDGAVRLYERMGFKFLQYSQMILDR